MQAYITVLRYDLWQLAHSWLLRIWVLLLIIPASFLVAVAANEEELASETLAAYIAAVLVPLSLLAVAILSSSAISGEAPIVADSILSKSVTRTEYMSAKITARMSVTLTVYAIGTVPFAYLIARYAVQDTTTSGIIVGLLMVASLFAFLAALGIAFSTILRNIQISVLSLLVVVLVSGAVLQFLGLHWMSTTAVVNSLPETFQGETPAWDQVRVLIVFPALTMAAISVSLWTFRRKDL